MHCLVVVAGKNSIDRSCVIIGELMGGQSWAFREHYKQSFCFPSLLESLILLCVLNNRLVVDFVFCLRTHVNIVKYCP